MSRRRRRCRATRDAQVEVSEWVAAKVSIDLRLKMVEAAGVEREHVRLAKLLVALGFWANSRRISHLGDCAPLHSIRSSPLSSTLFLER